MIEIKQLNKTYKTFEKQITALDDINITINDGEIFGIIGLSGAGKSTLVRCINLLERPTTGDVIIDGKSLTQLSQKELLLTRRNIGMIFQSFNLFEQRNVLRNVCYPLEIAGVSKANAIEKARKLIELVGLSDREKSFPSQLSGGQKQRVAIARALATDPKYLLCDEATSALDTVTEKLVQDALNNVMTNRTVFAIAHRLSTIQNADMIIVLDKGHIVEAGSHEELLALGGRYKKLHDTQFGKEK